MATRLPEPSGGECGVDAADEVAAGRLEETNMDALDGAAVADDGAPSGDRDEKCSIEKSEGANQEEEDKDICRICRCGSEVGPLFHPCACSGSIRHVHEECLEEWLRHSYTGGGGGEENAFGIGGRVADDFEGARCELCGSTFSFKPVFAPGTPERLSAMGFAGALCWTAATFIVPLVFRVALCIFTWTYMVPMVNSMAFRVIFYHGASWEKSWELLLEAFSEWPFAAGDEDVQSQRDMYGQWTSGFAVQATIIVSFLAVLSVFDYCRMHHRAVQLERQFGGNQLDGQNGREENQEREEQQRGVNAQDGDIVNDMPPPDAAAAPPPPVAPPIDPNENNFAGGGFGDADDVEVVEINIALDQLLGFRGTVLSLLHNVAWLITFNIIFMFVLVWSPMYIGSSVLGKWGLTTWPNASLWFSEEWRQLVLDPFRSLDTVAQGPLNSTKGIETLELSTSNPDVNVLVTFNHSKTVPEAEFWYGCEALAARAACFFAGYALLFLVRVVAGRAWRWTLRAIGHEQTDDFGWVEDCFKVCSLLFFKVGCFPIFLGAIIERCTRPRLDYTLEERYAFMLAHPILGTMILWIAGITFMLIVTILALQMREILHPDILHHFIRPHDPSINFLHQLLSEPMSYHAKKIAVTSFVYLFLIALFLRVPSLLLDAAGAPAVRPRLSYAFIECQLPLELVLFHFGVLYLLDHGKNVLQRFQKTYWERAAAILGVKEELLPLHGEVVGERELDSESSGDSDDEASSECSCDDHEMSAPTEMLYDSDSDSDSDDYGYYYPFSDTSDEEEEDLEEDVVEEENVPHRHMFPNPFQAPPNNNFDDEDAGPLLPRKPLSLVSVGKIGVLLLASWVVYFFLCALPFAIPLALGRVGMAIEIQVPYVSDHDPHAFVTGWLVVIACIHSWPAIAAWTRSGAQFWRGMPREKKAECAISLLLGAAIPLQAGFAFLVNAGFASDDVAETTCAARVQDALLRPGCNIVQAYASFSYATIFCCQMISRGRVPEYVLDRVQPALQKVQGEYSFGPLVHEILVPVHKFLACIGILPVAALIFLETAFPSLNACPGSVRAPVQTQILAGALITTAPAVRSFMSSKISDLHNYLHHQRYLIGQRLQNAGM